MSEHVEKEMKRLRKNILPQMPSNLFQGTPGSVKILHLNIGNLKRKMEDIKDDDIVKNSHISLNETHLGHSDILTPDMMHISKDVLIVRCDRSNKRRWCCPHCEQEPKSKTNQNEHNFGNCCYKDK